MVERGDFVSGTGGLTLRARHPGYAVMQKCLELQRDAPRQSAAARFFGRDPLAPAARTWFKGAVGERAVARILQTLGQDWTVLHAVPVGKSTSDIDHVLIGPTGVFTINTKNHAGQNVFIGGGSFMVNGHRHNHMQNASYEASRAADLLFRASTTWTPVQPLIVVAGAASLTFGRKRPDVVVLRAGHLRQWLFSLPRRLSSAEVAYLSMVAEERATWHVDAIVINDTLRQVQRFDRLEREVEQARRRRRAWRWWTVAGVVVTPFLAIVLVESLASLLLSRL